MPKGLEFKPTATAQDRASVLEVTKAQLERRKEALRVYKPMPFQEAIHACRSRRCLCQKGNRCGGPQSITEQALTTTGWTEIGKLNVGDKIVGGDGKPCNVTAVQYVGWLPIFELTFDDGAKVTCAENHHWKCKLKKTERFPSHPNYKEDKWGVYSLREIREHGGDDPAPRDRAVIPVPAVEYEHVDVPVPPYTLGVLLGDGCIKFKSIGFTSGDAEIAEHVSAELPEGMQIISRTREEYGSAASDFRLTKGSLATNPVIRGLKKLGLMGKGSADKFIPREYLLNSRAVRLMLLQGLMDTDGYCCERNGRPSFYSCSPQLAADVVELVRSLGGKARLRWKETFITEKLKRRGAPKKQPTDLQAGRLLYDKQRCLNMAEVNFSLPPGTPVFALSRKQDRRAAYIGEYTDGRILETIRPAGNAECVCLEVDSPDRTYVTRDYIVTHNSLAAAAETARALLGIDPHNKYPKTGRAVCLGWGQDHIGLNFHRLLFRPGAFFMRYNRPENRWEPCTKDDDDAKPAPPLIPDRYCFDWAWEIKAQFIFNRVVIRNPVTETEWELYACNSKGDPNMFQGTSVNLYWIDEDIERQVWYDEALMRTTDVGGRIIWTALPQGKNDAMLSLIEEAEEQAGSENPTAVLVRASMLDNIYTSDRAKQEDIETLRRMGEDVMNRRIYGHIEMSSRLVYPNFDKTRHSANGVAEGDTLSQIDRIRKILADNGCEPPLDWCRYATLDPGHQVFAILLWTVPPPELGDFKVVYRELCIRNADAAMFGQKFAKEVKGFDFQDFIIDSHGARLTSTAGGQIPRVQFEKALRDNGLRCVANGAAFTSGCDDPEFRENAVRDWLRVREDGTPTLLVAIDRCPNLIREFGRFRKKTRNVGGDVIILDEADRSTGKFHCIDCLEYGAAHGLAYRKPPSKVDSRTWLDRVLAGRAERAARRRATAGSKGIVLGARGA